VSRIVEATRERPYLALILPLDLSVLRGLEEEIGGAGGGAVSRALSVHEAEAPLREAFGRLLELVERPGEAGVLGPLPGVLGTMMAAEAIKVITGAGTPLRGEMLIHDALFGETRKIGLSRRADCPVCGTPAKGA